MHPSAAALMLALVAATVGWPVGAVAQPAADAPRPSARTSIGGEISGTISPEDDGFFTYTNYEQDALRQVRIRLLGEWRPAAALALVGEIRVLNAERIEAPAWYLRWQPMQGHALFVQLGRIPPVVGAFPRRAYGRDNALLATPLAYQYLMALRPDAIAASTDDLLGMRARGWQPSFPVGSDDVDTGLPLVSSAQWPTGGEAYWRRGWIEAAGALTLGGPAAPLVFGVHRGYEWSGRVAVTLPWGGIAGLSGARGRWLDDTLLAEIGGDARGQAAQTLIAMDAEYGRGPWLLRGEWLHTVFAVPLRDAPDVDRLPVASGFLDVQYRITPRWQIAWRLDHLAFGRLPSMSLPSPTWDADVLRIEGVVSYRATRRFEIRAGWLQHWRDGGSVRRRGAPAVQALYWF